jgi:hypothetical protein
MLVALPHALEDFHYAAFERFGVPQWAAQAVLAGSYLTQLIAIGLLASGRSAGGLVAGLVGLVWLAGDAALHGHDIVLANAAYRHGLISRLLEALIFVLGAACAWIGWRVWRLSAPR